MIVRLGTCCDAGGDTVLMKIMTSCVVHDDVMTSLVVDLILTELESSVLYASML